VSASNTIHYPVARRGHLMHRLDRGRGPPEAGMFPAISARPAERRPTPARDVEGDTGIMSTVAFRRASYVEAATLSGLAAAASYGWRDAVVLVLGGSR
jgi:hypothetical protein